MVKITGPELEIDCIEEDVSEKPCCCEEYKRKPVKRGSDKKPICEAKILRGVGYSKCQRPCTSSLRYGEIIENYCKEHRLEFLGHRACAHCHKFIRAGLAAICSLNPAHVSHVSCSRRFAKDGNSLSCSHCCSPAAKMWMTENLPIKENPILNYEEALKDGNEEVAERIIMKRTLDPGQDILPGFSEGGHLLELVSLELPGAVRTSRILGAAVTARILCSLARNYSQELFDSLELIPEFFCLLEETVAEEDNETPLSACARLQNWDYLKRLLKHFDYRGIDVEMQTGRDRRTVRQICTTAPKNVKDALEHAANIRRYSRDLIRKRVLHEDLSRGTERFPIRVINDVDDEAPASFTYSTRVVDRTGILKLRKSDEMLICNCRSGCETDCECSSGVYDEEGRARLDRLEAPFLECSSDCLCNMACGNRVAQKGATHPIEVFRTHDGRGWGVRAMCRIRKGSFIGEYTGELLTDPEANRRIDSYLFETSVGEQNFTVDARLLGNFTRFINHSCQPNAKVCMVVWDWQVEQLSHICIFALTDIFKGEEMTISYGEHWWRAKIMEFPCRCQRAACEFTELKRQALLRKQAETCSTASTSSYDSEAVSE